MFFLYEFEPMFMCIVVASKRIFFTTSMEIIFYNQRLVKVFLKLLRSQSLEF